MKKSILLMVLLAGVIFAPRVFAAQEETVWELAKSEKYGNKFGWMLMRGLLNACTCFVDLIVHTVEGTQQGPPFVGTLTGLGSGIGCTVLRAGSGVLDVATFWVPGFNGIPVSRSYSNCLEEEAAKAPASAAPVYAPAPPVTYEPPAPAPVKKKHDALDYVKK